MIKLSIKLRLNKDNHKSYFWVEKEGKMNYNKVKRREYIGILYAILFAIWIINNQLVLAADHSTNISTGMCKLIVSYGVMAIISLFLLIGYCAYVKVKEIWMFLLYIAVLIVNIGYLALVISK